MPPFARSVRFKLTLWYSGLLLVFGIAFVLSLNLAARLDRPGVDTANFRLRGVYWETVVTGPGQALLIPRSVTLQQAGDSAYTQNLERLRIWSLFAVFGLAVASGVGGYILSGMLLQPVRKITQVASEIGTSNLHQRINHQGADDELKALADTFDSMIDRLEHSFVAQRRFVQDASHELRTPLAAIRMNIEVTEMDPDVTQEEYRALLETVKQQTERLTRLSDDLMLLTSTSEGEAPDVDPVQLSRVAHEVISQLSPLAGTENISLVAEGDTDLEAEASGDLLYRCVFNLVDNAIKYAGDSSVVRIRSERRGAAAIVSVADNGAGIEPEATLHLFERFYRVDRGRSRKQGGSGLGLSIVKELVEAMGGTVTVDSTVGKGTTFTISLKATPVSARAATTPRAALASG